MSHTLLAPLRSLIQELTATEPKVASLLEDAGILIAASDEKISPAVDDLAGALRQKLPGLDHEESVRVASDLLAKYGEESGTAQAALPFGNFERRKGPDPASSGMYQPGVPFWWVRG